MINQYFQKVFRHIDSILMSCILFTLLVGLFILYSASGQDFNRVNAQLINIVIAMSGMWLAANISPQHMERLAFPLYLFGVFLLISVAIFGDISHGARRWLNLGVVKIQPSELMRIAVPMMLAWFFSRRESSLRIIDFFLAFILLLIPVLLILKQPDLGTSLLVGAAGFFVIFLAGLSWRFILGGAVAAGALAPIFGHCYMIIKGAGF